MNGGARMKAREMWGVESVRREAARKKLGITLHIPENEVVEYEEIMKSAREIYSIPPAPAMPLKPPVGAVGKPPHLAIVSGSH